MSVDLGDLLDSLKREVSAPGAEETTFPGATDDSWLGFLMDGFWEARFDGLIASWTLDGNGIVTPIAPNGVDIPRDLQQVVVFYAGFRIVRNALKVQQTSFHAKAGDVEYQTGYSATTLRDVLKALTDQRNLLLTRLSDLGVVNPVYIDAVLARSRSYADGNTFFAGA